MNPTTPESIVALVTHARQVRAADRSAFAEAARSVSPNGAFILETCHRVEAYSTSVEDGRRLGLVLPAGGEVLTGERAVHHAMRVAVGRDSVVLGEDQILHQLRRSVDAARSSGSFDGVLERLFTLALQAGRRARSWRQGPTRSLADVALESIEGLVGPIAGRPVLIVGAGMMGRIATRAAIAAGASVAVSSRSVEAARALAASVGVRPEAFDPGSGIGAFVAVIVALRGPWPIGGDAIKSLVERRVVVVDLSVPVAVPVELSTALAGRVITADALALSAAARPSPERELDRLDALASRMTAEFLTWLGHRDGRAAAETLVARAELERSLQLEALWRRLPDLGPDARQVIEEMTRHFAERLLREPLERLGRDADGHSERAVREIFAL